MDPPTTPKSTQATHTTTPTTPHSDNKQRRLLSSQRIPSTTNLQNLTTSPSQYNFDTRTPTNPQSQRSNFLKHSRSHSSSNIVGNSASSNNNLANISHNNINNLNNLNSKNVSNASLSQVKKKQQTPYFSDYSLNKYIDRVEKPVLNWRIENRIRTASLGIILALNLRVGSPDAPPTPRPHEECWIIPSRKAQDNAIDIVNNRLQEQYSQWAPRSNSKNRGGIKYKSVLDPTIDDVNKLCTSLRQYAREKRVLFHYNGHGVPRPTQYGELWVLNKDLTQYIPLSLFDLQNWVKTPSVFVFDCSNAGLLISWLLKFCEQREDEIKRAGTTSDHSEDSEGSSSSYKDFMAFGACSEDESLPSNPELPADLFTACITTPIKMALSWSCSRSILLKSLSGKERQYKELIEHIPGTMEDRTSPFGELNWIFTSITDTIAWQSLPSDMFQTLFRQDAVVASLFRNFLLADRIMRHAHCTPVSYPRLPPTHQHPLWQTWDQVVDVFLSQLPSLVNGSEQYKPSRFFDEQLMAFEVWLNFGTYQKRPPEQLPILLQALLSPIHRFKALKLLRSYLDLGTWSVNLALSVGVFHYILRLLQKSSSSNVEVLVQIWCKILSVDRSCQGESIKAGNQSLFIKVMANKENEFSPQLRSAAGFILSVLMDQYPAGQLACYQSGILKVCDELLLDPEPTLRYTALVCLGKMWEDNKELKFQAIKEQIQDRVCSRITDSSPKVRSAALFALGTFIYTGNPNGTLELSLANSLRLLTSDISPIVRRELIDTLSMTIAAYEQRFIEIAISTAKQEVIKQLSDAERESCRVVLSSSYGSLWRALCSLQVDPIPEIAQSANRIIIIIHCIAANIILENADKEPHSDLIHTYLLQVATSNQQKNSSLADTKNSSNSKGDRLKKHFQDWRTRSSYKQPSVTPSSLTASTPNPSRSSQIVPNNRASMMRPRNPNRLYVPEKSQLFNESVYFVQTNSIEVPPKDLTSPAEQTKQWKRQQQSLMLNGINEIKSQVATSKLETQVSVMDNQPYPITKMLVHPSFPIIVAASNDTINIWDWKESDKITTFSNTNSQNTYISSLSFVNQLEDTELLMTGASDGIIRVWSANYNEKTKANLVTAWRAHKQPNNSSGLVHIWNERAGSVITAGEYPIMRVWDIERALAIQDIPTESQSCITSMTYDKSTGNIVIVGAVDGSVRVFDCRISSKASLIQTYSEHTRPIVNVEMLYRSNKIVSGSFGGDVRFWDLRMSTSTSVLQAHSRSDMTTLAVHLQVPIVATGTHKQTIKVSNHDGTRLSDIKYYNKFLGQRIGAVSSLCFHPYEPFLAAGGTDSVIAMYQSSVCIP